MWHREAQQGQVRLTACDTYARAAGSYTQIIMVVSKESRRNGPHVVLWPDAVTGRIQARASLTVFVRARDLETGEVVRMSHMATSAAGDGGGEGGGEACGVGVMVR
jgi:hypothetical protein